MSTVSPILSAISKGENPISMSIETWLCLMSCSWMRLMPDCWHVSSVEHASIRKIHKQLGVKPIYPDMAKHKVLQELGFPVISKAKANKIKLLLTPDSPKQTFIHAIMTGDMGEQGRWEHSNKIKLPEKWIVKFGGHYQEHRLDAQAWTSSTTWQQKRQINFYPVKG